MSGSDQNENVSFLHLFPKAFISNCAPAGKFWTVWKFQAESGCEAWREGLTALLVALVNNCYPCQQMLPLLSTMSS